MTRTLVAAGISIVVGIAVSAAGRPQGRGQAPAPINACSLLTKQEAAAALGEAVKDGESGTAGRSIMPNTAASYCEYMSTTSIHRVHVNVWRTAPDSAALKQMGQIVCASKTKDGLAGLGETACWYDAEHGELQVFKGANFLDIEMSRSGDATESMKTVAKTALARLP